MNAPAAEPPSRATPNHRLQVEGLTGVREGRTLFAGIDVALASGELVQIEGANGAGKTTLLRMICGLSMPEAGRVRWDGADVADDPDPFRRALTFVGHAAGVKRDLTPRENLQAALAIAGGGDGARCATALERVGLDGRADTPLRRLSAGQARRVSLARLLLRPNPLWVLDEPFSALDVAGKAMLEALVVDHCRNGGMALLTTHQPADFGALPVR
ncbi:MAG: cytochrome c biogenesis heme-transporting ATPase CcmA, partial [Halofilum sp. (in: g-proteobacteria)]|nr:cytochrome c biogenesis heme-transporting ATPase CcmA [Halofilum sp. (in: g-proteobacteria)]